MTGGELFLGLILIGLLIVSGLIFLVVRHFIDKKHKIIRKILFVIGIILLGIVILYGIFFLIILIIYTSANPY